MDSDLLRQIRALKALDPKEDHEEIAILQIEGGRRVANSLFQRIVHILGKPKP